MVYTFFNVSMRLMSIQEAIDRSGMSQREVAQAMSVDESTVSRWCNGGCSLTLEHAITLAKLLRIPVDNIRW